MRLLLALLIIATVPTLAAVKPAFGAQCRMEKQCHWKNFKKYCVWVKVCR
jgi:hypothetical protein